MANDLAHAIFDIVDQRTVEEQQREEAARKARLEATHVQLNVNFYNENYGYTCRRLVYADVGSGFMQVKMSGTREVVIPDSAFGEYIKYIYDAMTPQTRTVSIMMYRGRRTPKGRWSYAGMEPIFRRSIECKGRSTSDSRADVEAGILGAIEIARVSASSPTT